MELGKKHFDNVTVESHCKHSVMILPNFFLSYFLIKIDLFFLHVNNLQSTIFSYNVFLDSNQMT